MKSRIIFNRNSFKSNYFTVVEISFSRTTTLLCRKCLFASMTCRAVQAESKNLLLGLPMPVRCTERGQTKCSLPQQDEKLYIQIGNVC